MEKLLSVDNFLSKNSLHVMYRLVVVVVGMGVVAVEEGALAIVVVPQEVMRQ